MDNFDTHKWFKKQYLEEGHTGETDVLPAELKENMSPAEAVVELNVYMNELQDISSAVSRIMEQYFPDEFNQGDAYGAFDFGSSRNRFDTTFESILDNLASVGDDME